ncbi:NTP transferase domain-containing protein [Agromyces neolithicus]|uniref:NTP transferase domain-containing protein n=2 Tax=Agromyces neolithicus TaxID=269420 RepID=A0ABN2LZX0_9MICO
MGGDDGLAFDAIILAGGRSSRLGGSPKAELVIGSRRLVDIAVDAASAVGAHRTVVVGPDGLVTAPVITAREQPPFGGPVAGLAAGLAALDRLDADAAASARSEAEPEPETATATATDPDADATAGRTEPADHWVLALTCDLPLAAAAAAELVAAARTTTGATQGICLDDGRPQWLPTVYRRDVLARALAELGDPHGASMRALADHLALTTIPDPGGLTIDVDTWQDVERARTPAEPTDEASPSPRAEGAGMPNTSQSPESLDRWLAALATELGIEPADVPIGEILDLARDVAHGVARPAAPLSAFVVGLAVGAGNGSLAELSARATALAEGWSSDEPA